MSPETPDRAPGLLRREPLVLFLVVGALLFVGWRSLSPSGVDTIRIEAQVLRLLEKQQEDLVGRPLTDEEREQVRESYIEDEVLVREALKRGLQYSDFRVRQRLTRIMRSASTESVPDPSVAQLQAYFQDNIDRYTTSESVTFELVLYPWGTDVADEELRAVLAELEAGADPAGLSRSEMPGDVRMPRRTRSELVSRFGADFANVVEAAPEGAWQGPVESLQGVQFFRVVERHPPQVAEFEQVESYLRQDWLMTQTRARQQARIDDIRSRYRVEFVEE